jgi:UDP-N-acetylmuramate--alanine ligase
MHSFDLFFGESELCRICLKVTGLHNVYNALAVSAAAYEYGIAPEAIKKGLEDFRGIGRRMEYNGSLNGARVFDDYAHHPTEIAATLKGAREMAEGKLICAFQPHTYSRTKALFDGFVSALAIADEVILAPIYAAREPNDPEVSSERLASALGERASACESVEALAKELEKRAAAGDTVIVMGAGDIDKVCKILNFDKV